MKKITFFTFRTNQDDNKDIAQLARLLVRSKSDAVRFAIKKFVHESHLDHRLNERPNHEPSN